MANLQERNDLSEAMGPLKGLKVLDFTQFQNGPSCTGRLADLWIGDALICGKTPPWAKKTQARDTLVLLAFLFLLG